MSNKIVKFTDLLDCPKTLIPNDVIVVDSLGTGLTEVSIGSILPPIGTGAQYDIPTFTGGLSPVFADSGIAIKDISTVFPAIGKYIDLDVNAQNTEIIGTIDVIGNKSLFVGANLFNPIVPSVDSDVLISNSSQGDKNLFIANISGTGNNVLEIAGDNVTIRDSTALKNITIDINSISLTDGIGNNNINMLPNSLNISTNNNGNIMQLYADNNINLVSNQGAITSTASFGTNTVSGDILQLDSNTLTIMNNTSAGHFISMSPLSGVTIASNSIQDLYLACDGNLRIKATSSFGIDGQVLSRVSGGSGDRCLWANPIQLKRLVYNTAGFLASGSASGTRFFNEAGGTFVISGNNSTTSVVTPLFINSADYPTIGTLTPKLQIEMMISTNATNLNVGTFNVNLSTFATSGNATQMILTQTSNVGSGASITTPALSTTTRALSVPFVFPADGFYTLTLQHAFNTVSLLAITGRVYVIYE